MERCSWLRWKGYHVDRVSEARVREVFEANQVPYSCLRTCQGWGPDDQLVAPEACDRRRACFEAEPSAQT